MSTSSDDELPDIPNDRLVILKISHSFQNGNNFINRFPWMKDRDPSSDKSSVSSQTKVKRPKLSVAMKGRSRGSKMKKKDYIESDDDFVNETPGTSRCINQPKPKQQNLTKQEMKRKNDRERQAKLRAKQSKEKKDQRRTTDALRKQAKRVAETTEEHHERNRKDAERKAKLRAKETSETHQDRIRKQKERQANLRANETPAAHEHRISEQAERQAVLRENQTPEQQLKEREAAKERMATARKYTSAGYKDATKSQDILQGKFQVRCLNLLFKVSD